MLMYAEHKQKKPAGETVQKKKEADSMPNLTGIPDAIKSRFESISGLSFEDVRVHYNSDKPAQLQALAYTQGEQIYIAPGQQKHLSHELVHVAQQKQNRVRPSFQLNGIPVNADIRLEEEADQGIPIKSGCLNSGKPATSVQMVLGLDALIRSFRASAPHTRPPFESHILSKVADLRANGYYEHDLAHRLSFGDIERILTSEKKAKIDSMIRQVTIPERQYGHLKAFSTRYYDYVMSSDSGAALLSHLNSSPVNLRPGNKSFNRSIGRAGDLRHEDGDPLRPLSPQSEALSAFVGSTRGFSSDMYDDENLAVYEKIITDSWK